MPLVVGQTVKDRYRITRVISIQGGFGNTYLAYDSARGHEVVIKESKTAADVEQDALLGELKLLLSLDHPRLPKVYDGFFYERQLCVTMQYIPGRDVSSYLVVVGPERRAEPPDRPTALRWISQTLEALAYLHGRGIVHRDVKPSNLRVHTETGEIYLLDFGISQHVDRALIRAHSPRFSPPEQHDPQGVTTPASDVYAVGATLYMLLTGREPPYRDDRYDKTLRLPSEENRTIPRELEEVVVRAMCYSQAERFPDARAMLDELQRLGYAAHPPAPEQPANEGALPGEGPESPQAEPRRALATITLPNPDLFDAPAEKSTLPATGLPLNEMIKGRYNIREVISERGGFGVTYRAVDTRRDKEVAIKVSKAIEESTFDSLLSERELLSKLKHPRLPEVYEVFSYGGLLCISMQYIRGRDVSSYLRDGPLDRRTAMQWIRQLLEALAYLHKRAIVHCDVKPSNLRIDTETGNLFLLDFGISQQNNELVVRGFSAHYSAPEQRLRNGQVSPATDVYAAGAILYTFLTGTPPPERTSQTEPVLFLDSDRHAIPEELKSITRKALRADAADRYPHAQAMLDELLRLPYTRSAPAPALLWGLVGAGVVLLVAMAFLISTLVTDRLAANGVVATTTAAETTAVTAPPASPDPSAGPEVVPPAPAAEPAPPPARTVIAADAAALLAPASRTQAPAATAAPTVAATSTPQSLQVRQIEVAGQSDSAAINVRQLPVQLTVVGDGLGAVTSAALRPQTPGQRAIPLELVQVETGRLSVALTALPPSFRVGEYELLLNQQVIGALTLRDYIREARLQGVKQEYRYLAAIRPFPGIRFGDQEIAGPFALLYRQPDPTSRGAYLRNGDVVEILDETSHPELYLVRVKENFDAAVVGREGWVLAWVVEGVPPAPPQPGAIQMPYNIRGEPRERVIEWLLQRGVAADRISSDFQTRERIPDVFDTFQAGQVVSSSPAEGAWIAPESQVVLGVRAP